MTEREHTVERADLGVVTALALEARPLRERLADVVDFHPDGLRISVGRLGQTSVAVVAGGVGPAAARRATRLVIEGHRPARVVAAGLCGGLDSSLVRGRIVVAGSVMPSLSNPDAHPNAHSTGVRTLGRPGKASLDRLPGTPLVGLVVSTDRVIDTVAAKRHLHEATGAVAVDMESWWIADESARAGIEPWVVRVVSDTATETIPADVAELGGSTSTARVAGAAIRLLWNRPSSLFDMAELRERAHQAADTLADALATLVRTD